MAASKVGMRKHQIVLIVALACLFGLDGRAATLPIAVDPPAEPGALRLDASKAAAASASTPRVVPEGTIHGNPLWAIPLRQLSATRERPLFVPSRRAPPPVIASAPRQPPPPPVEKPPEAEPLQLSLIGTVAGENGSLGVFLDKAGGAPLRLKVGQMHKGWTLRSVGRRDVILAKGTATTKLAMVTAEPAKSKGVDTGKVVPPPQASTPSQPPTKMQTIEAADTPRFDPRALNIFKLAK